MNDQEQIEKISESLRVLKRKYKYTVIDIISHLPQKLQMSRTGFNAYLLGTIKKPPSRETLIEFLIACGADKKEVNQHLKLCGYCEIEKSAVETFQHILNQNTKEELNKLYSHIKAMSKNELLIEMSKLYDKIGSLERTITELTGALAFYRHSIQTGYTRRIEEGLKAFRCS